jgi:hypothetical protein
VPTSEVTYVTRVRGHVRAAAIVPADWVEAYETMLDRSAAKDEDVLVIVVRIAHRREVYRTR